MRSLPRHLKRRNARRRSLEIWTQRAAWMLPAAALTLVTIYLVATPPRDKLLGTSSGSPLVHGYISHAERPHDSGAFTQGLFFHRERLFESVGHYGRSEVRQVDIDTGEVVLRHKLADRDFAEGSTLLDDDTLLCLTWMSNRAYLLNVTTLRVLAEVPLHGHAWGAARHPQREELFISDGTPVIRVLHHRSFEQLRTIRVYDAKRPIHLLNELEVVEDELWANVYGSLFVARIDPSSGRVLSWVDFEGLLRDEDTRFIDVMNGIAYDAERHRLWVTGKYWSHVYEVSVSNTVLAKDVAHRNPIFFQRSILSHLQRGLQLSVDTDFPPNVRLPPQELVETM